MRFAFVSTLGPAVCIALSGCGAAASVDGYARSDRLAIAREQYIAQKAQCERMGGSMSMRTRPLEPPGLTEYRSATCVRR